jgi:hypothetical protein
MPTPPEAITERGGFSVGKNRWDAINGSWPFGTLVIQQDRLVLGTLWKKYDFPHSSIVALSVIRIFFFPALRIEHSISLYPAFVAFGSLRMARLRRRLTEAGFRVDDAKV